MTSGVTAPLDLDQVDAVLAGLKHQWQQQGLIVRPLLWSDARDSWPRTLHTDRSQVAEPESVGLTLTGPDGREGRLVIWRGGWADIHVLAGGAVTTRNPEVPDLAACAAQAAALAAEITAPRSRTSGDPLDLRPVTILWVTDWWDGPVEGMASYQGNDCWFRAIFDDAADEWTGPRRCRLYQLSQDEQQRLWAEHRAWEQHVGGNSCYHPGAPSPALKDGWQAYTQRADRQGAQTGALIGEFTAPPMLLPDGTPPDGPRPGPAEQES
jgi:hypothetical protein